MKRYEVSFRPQAEADLFDLYRYIARESGTAVAGAYIDRIETACLALETFPERGTRREFNRAALEALRQPLETGRVCQHNADRKRDDFRKHNK